MKTFFENEARGGGERRVITIACGEHSAKNINPSCARNWCQNLNSVWGMMRFLAPTSMTDVLWSRRWKCQPMCWQDKQRCTPWSVEGLYQIVLKKKASIPASTCLAYSFFMTLSLKAWGIERRCKMVRRTRRKTPNCGCVTEIDSWLLWSPDLCICLRRMPAKVSFFSIWICPMNIVLIESVQQKINHARVLALLARADYTGSLVYS